MTIDDTIRSFRPMIRKLVHERFGGIYSVSRDELEAQALVAAWKAIEGYDDSRGLALTTHVYTRVYYRLVDLLRGEGIYKRMVRGRPTGRMRDVQLSAYDDDVFAAPGECTVDGDDLVESVLSGLNPRTREVVRFRLDGYTAVETADRMGITSNGVFWHMRQARKAVVYRDLAAA